MNRIEVHPIEVRGQKYTVQVDRDGMFYAYNNSGIEAEHAETRKSLLDKLTRQTKAASVQVSVPITRLKNGYAQHGVATGIHATSRNILVRWNGQKPEQISMRRGEILGGMSDEEGREWERLAADVNAAGRAIYAFRQAREIDLFAVIRARIAEQLDT